LNSWITRRACDSSVIHIRPICGTLINVFEAKRIEARCLVDATFDCFDSRFNRCPSCGANSRTNTSGGRIDTSSGRMRPDSTPNREVPPGFRSNVLRGRTSRRDYLYLHENGAGAGSEPHPHRTLA
jgi:hypothetical protein